MTFSLKLRKDEKRELGISWPKGRPESDRPREIPNLYDDAITRPSIQRQDISQLLPDSPPCCICGSKVTRPLKPITNNPLEVGLCISRESWALLEHWNIEASERARALHMEDNSPQKGRERDGLTTKKVNDIKERLKYAKEEEKPIWQGALRIEQSKLLNVKKAKNGEEVERTMDLYLVPTKMDDSALNLSILPSAFSIRIHIIPRRSLPPRTIDGVSYERRRDIWLCLGNTSSQDWDVLRSKSLEGQRVYCTMADASGTFRINAFLKRLDKSRITRREILKRRVTEPSEQDKRVELRLCIVHRVSESDETMSPPPSPLGLDKNSSESESSLYIEEG